MYVLCVGIDEDDHDDGIELLPRVPRRAAPADATAPPSVKSE
jgi:hypothetical protein